MNKPPSQKGFSLPELLAVLVLLIIVVSMSVISIIGSRKYAADDQALKIIDFLDQARQSALNNRRTFRVEINKTKKQITLINENEPGIVSDDAIVKRSPLSDLVFVGEVPTNISAAPTASSPIPVLDYASSSYPLSANDQKITLRFTKKGRVENAGNDNIGTGSIVTGATIYLFSNNEKTKKPEIIRAITVLQTSGDTAILKCAFGSDGKCGNWKR